MGSQWPAGLLVGVRVPQAALLSGAGPGGVFFEDVVPDEDLVLDDDGNLAPTVLHEVGQAPVAQVGLKAVADDVGAGDPCVGIEPREILGVVVVPDQPGTLLVRVVVFRLARLQARVKQLIDVARCTVDTRAVLAVWGKPGEGAAVADPGCEPPCTWVVVAFWRFCALVKLALVSTGRMCFDGSVFVNVSWIGFPRCATMMPPRCLWGCVPPPSGTTGL